MSKGLRLVLNQSTSLVVQVSLSLILLLCSGGWCYALGNEQPWTQHEREGQLAFNRANLSKAQEALSYAAKEAEDAGAPEVIRILRMLSDVYHLEHQDTLAEKTCRHALALCKNIKADQDCRDVSSCLAILLMRRQQYNEAAEIYKSLMENYENGDPRRLDNPYRDHYLECLRHLGRNGDIALIAFMSALHKWFSLFVQIFALPVTGDWEIFVWFCLVRLVLDYFTVKKVCAVVASEAVLLTLSVNAISVLLILLVRLYYHPSFVYALLFASREHLQEGYARVAAMAICQAICISLFSPLVEGLMIRYVFRYKKGLDGYKWFWFSNLASIAIVGTAVLFIIRPKF